MSTLPTVASREPATDATPADVHAYARAVRRHLSGLSPDQVDDLTDGLEADLADALADRPEAGADLVAQFGPPAEYAAELRAAAGLGEAPAERGRRRRALGARLASWRDRLLAPLRAQPWWPGAAGLAVELAPAWWVLRGYVLFQVWSAMVGSQPVMLPDGVGGWVVLLLMLVVSVQWGRRRWRTRRWVRLLATAAQVVAIVALVPTTLYLADSVARSSTTSTVYESPEEGVYVDGEPATNLFVYDRDGLPVPDAQVYDQSGRPVSVGTGVYEWDDDGEQWELVPFEDLDGTPRANVYPRARVPSGFADGTTASAVGEAVDAPLPFAQAPALRSRSQSGPGSATAPGPTATPGSATTDAAGTDAEATDPSAADQTATDQTVPPASDGAAATAAPPAAP